MADNDVQALESKVNDLMKLDNDDLKAILGHYAYSEETPTLTKGLASKAISLKDIINKGDKKFNDFMPKLQAVICPISSAIQSYITDKNVSLAVIAIAGGLGFALGNIPGWIVALIVLAIKLGVDKLCANYPKPKPQTV
jgi:hypothetical protein